MIRTFDLRNAAATDALGSAFARHLQAGDTLLLSGPVGAGKTTFARALIGARLAALGHEEEVPSPSYTLVQTYDLDGVELWHADLYRLGDACELCELGLEEAFASAITLVEWGERLGVLAPARALRLHFDFPPEADSGRRLRIEASGPGWAWLGSALPAGSVLVP